jgi:DNA replication and repair protein RecF
VLAQAGLVGAMTGFAPILLLDEVIAHLDPPRRTSLYDELAGLGAQVWMTGADPAAFTDLTGRAEVFEVSPGRVVRKV